MLTCTYNEAITAQFDYKYSPYGSAFKMSKVTDEFRKFYIAQMMLLL